MSCTDLFLVAGIVVVGSTTAAAQGVTSDTPKTQAQMDAAGSGASQSFLRKRNKDGTVTYYGRMHEGRGMPIAVKVPTITPEVKIDIPIGRDENGKTVMLQQKLKETVIRGVLRQKAERGDLKTDGVRIDQKAIWAKKNKETLERIRTEGPITNHNFIHPGTTPEQSRLINSDKASVRIRKDGSKEYVLREDGREKVYDTLKKTMCASCTVEESGKSDAYEVDVRLTRRARPLQFGNEQDVDLRKLFPDMPSMENAQ